MIDWSCLRAGYVALVLIITSPVRADVSGYLKSLVSHGDTVIAPSVSASVATQRARINVREQFGDAQVLLAYDFEWQTGTYLTSEQYRLQTALKPEPYWPLQNQLDLGSNDVVKHGAYRAYVRVPVDAFDIRLGRQQLNWSQTFLWSSIDRFNPLIPTQLEPEEREGVDALQVFWTSPDDDTLEFVAVARRSADAYGLRYRTHIASTDFNLIIADYGETNAIGLSAAGQWRGAGWRFEVTGNRKHGTSRRYADVILSLEYALPGQTTLIAEWLYRGDGASGPADYRLLDLLRGKRTELARRYLGTVIRKEFEPIGGLDVVLIYNLDDKSVALLPSLRFSPHEDFHFRLGLQWFGGAQGSEFGEANRLVFGEIQWFY